MKQDYEKLYREAEMIATLIHEGQRYDIFPYKKHLEDVVDILIRFGFSGDIRIAGWFHDGVEDTYLTYSKIKALFGELVAEIVFAVTDELGRNREEKKKRTYPKIRAFGEKAIVVKLADRIANTEHSKRMDNRGKVKMYKDEYSTFRKELYAPGTMADPLWEYLDKLNSFEPAMVGTTDQGSQ